MKPPDTVDSQDVIFAFDCGCYVREGYYAMSPPDGVRCDLHETAKDLLKACKEALTDISSLCERLEDVGKDTGDYDMAIERLKAIISKAEGED